MNISIDASDSESGSPPVDHDVSLSDVAGEASSAAVEYFSASYVNSETGVRTEIMNISEVDEASVVMRIENRCPSRKRIHIDRLGEKADSLSVWKQPYVLTGSALLAPFPIRLR